MTILDGFQRPIEYLRLSVTDRCNLRCRYCMPPAGVTWEPPETILRYEEFVRIVRLAAELGIHKLRITGGEPLVRRGIVGFVHTLAQIPGLDDLAMTTNGTLLASFAQPLAEAGLNRVNISLDTLHPDRFRQITRRGNLADVLAGIEAAQKAGLHPVKLNTVAIRGFNDDELVDLARMSRTHGWHVRFIELMPIGMWQERDRNWWQNAFIPIHKIRQLIEQTLGPLEPQQASPGGGPARYYRLPGAEGTIGLISAVSEHFCTGCNRLRLSADGRLRPCLLSDAELDLRAILRNGADDEQLRTLLLRAIREKPRGHQLEQGHFPHHRTMSQIGG